MASAGQREAEARQAKLEHMREQIASGHLVIREMTGAERAKWAKQRGMLEASSTPAERARRDAALKNRRRRAERLS